MKSNYLGVIRDELNLCSRLVNSCYKVTTYNMRAQWHYTCNERFKLTYVELIVSVSASVKGCIYRITHGRQWLAHEEPTQVQRDCLVGLQVDEFSFCVAPGKELLPDNRGLYPCGSLVLEKIAVWMIAPAAAIGLF